MIWEVIDYRHYLAFGAFIAGTVGYLFWLYKRGEKEKLQKSLKNIFMIVIVLVLGMLVIDRL